MYRTAAALLFAIAAPATAQMAAPMMTTPANEATPPPALATTQAQPYLYAAGQSDLYEISSSLVALQRSQNPAVRQFAQRMIEHHTETTNAALMAAKQAGVVAPPPVLDESGRQKITALLSAPATGFDREFLTQQDASHQAALQVVSGYAERGDVPALRQAATRTVPIVSGHLTTLRTIMARM